ncbi:MAG: hypothetical protein L0Z54_00790 [Thermoplasmata archaeon]|nr:hypothetical protein [Thermoplasmata archaeon]
MNSMLVGYIRRSNSGAALKISVNAEAFGKAHRYLSKDGEEFVPLVVGASNVRAVLDGQKEVTGLNQISD